MPNALDRTIDAHAEAAFAFLEALVRAPSVVGSEQAALDVFAHEAASLGLTVRRLPFSNDRVTDPRAGVTQPAALLTSDRYQVLATTPGDGDLLLLLNGHMDVVPAEIARTVDVAAVRAAAPRWPALWPRRRRHEEWLCHRNAGPPGIARRGA